MSKQYIRSSLEPPNEVILPQEPVRVPVEAPVETPKDSKESTVVKKSDKSIMVDIDTAYAEVLRYDEENRIIHFVETPGKFLRLNDDQIDKLSDRTKAAYLLSERMHKKAIQEAEEPNLFRPGAIAQTAMATSRLEVRNKKPGRHYLWARPDEYRQRVVYEGYQVENDDGLDTFVKGPSSARTVGEMGSPEYILMSIPEEVHLQRLREVERISQERNASAQESGRSEIGGTAYEPDKDPRDTARNWRET